MIISDADKRQRSQPSALDGVFKRIQTMQAATSVHSGAYPATSEGIARLNADGAAFRQAVRTPEPVEVSPHIDEEEHDGLDLSM